MNAQHRFQALVGALLPDLYRYAVWLCRDPHLAEDLVQDSLLRAWRALDTLRDEAAAKSWLITILRRELARHYSRSRPVTVDIDAMALGDAGAGPEADAETANLRRAMAGLPDEYREPLVLQVLLGYSVDDIATVMEMNSATVLTRLYRARQKLVAQLTPAAEVRA